MSAIAGEDPLVVARIRINSQRRLSAAHIDMRHRRALAGVIANIRVLRRADQRNAPTREMLGADIGASREAVTRQLCELERLEFIRLGRGLIEVTDLDRLRHLYREAAGAQLYTPTPR